MNQFTTDIVDALVKIKDLTEVFRLHLENAVNVLIATELTVFVYYEKYDRVQAISVMVPIPVRCTLNMGTFS